MTIRYKDDVIPIGSIIGGYISGIEGLVILSAGDTLCMLKSILNRCPVGISDRHSIDVQRPRGCIKIIGEPLDIGPPLFVVPKNRAESHRILCGVVWTNIDSGVRGRYTWRVIKEWTLLMCNSRPETLETVTQPRTDEEEVKGHLAKEFAFLHFFISLLK
jgi:hypothetical protein